MSYPIPPSRLKYRGMYKIYGTKTSAANAAVTVDKDDYAELKPTRRTFRLITKMHVYYDFSVAGDSDLVARMTPDNAAAIHHYLLNRAGVTDDFVADLPLSETKTASPYELQYHPIPWFDDEEIIFTASAAGAGKYVTITFMIRYIEFELIS